MDPITIPEDMSELSDEEMAKLRTKLSERASELAAEEDPSDEIIDQIEAIAEAVEAINVQSDQRAEAATARRERLDKAMSSLAGPPEEEEKEEEPATTEVSAEDEGENKTVAEPVAETEAAPEAVAASGTRRTSSAGGLATRRPKTNQPKEAPRDFMRATANAIKLPAGSVLSDTFAVAQAIVDTKQGWTRSGNVGAGAQDYVAIASGVKEGFDHSLGLDPMENFTVLQDVRNQLKGDTFQALVAAGGVCAPLTPLYDFFRTAEAQNPVEDALPVANAPRGGIRYIVPPVYTQAEGAVGSFDNFATTAQPDKPCLHVECPDVAEEFVSAVTQCVEFDNLQYRVFPEQVSSFMEDVAVIFAQAKERKHLDYIDSRSTAVSADTGYGAARSLMYEWTLAASAYRKRAQMRRNAMLQLFVPDWAVDVIKADMANDGDDGLNFMNVPDSDVNAMLRSHGLDPTWTNDTADALRATQEMRGAQAAGLLNDWPALVTAYLFAPGTFVRLDAGTLDVGLVRDSTLNKQNNVQLFMEEWTGTAQLGQESIRLTSTVCASGARPDYVVPFCP